MEYQDWHIIVLIMIYWFVYQDLTKPFKFIENLQARDLCEQDKSLNLHCVFKPLPLHSPASDQ